MEKGSFLILYLIMMFFLNAYGQNSYKDINQTDSYNLNKNHFFIHLNQNKLMDYETRTSLLFESPEWETGALDTGFFVLLFNYMLIDRRSNEEFSENLSEHLYNLFVKYPYDILQLQNFVVLLEDRDKDYVIDCVLTDLFFETEIRRNLCSDEPNLSEMDFFQIFPFLYCTNNYVRIHHIIENYYK